MRLFAQLAQMGRGEVWQASSNSDRLEQGGGKSRGLDLRSTCGEKGTFAVSLLAVCVCGLVRSSSPRLLGSCWSYPEKDLV